MGGSQWYPDLTKAFATQQRGTVEKVLHLFMNKNRCLFPEFRTTDLREELKKDQA